MNTKSIPDSIVISVMFVVSIAISGANSSAAQTIQGDKAQERLIRASQGLQYPGSESDSTWSFVSYGGFAELPDAATFERVSGCPVIEGGGTDRLDFDAALERLGTVQRWMDRGQSKSARGFHRLQGLFHRTFGDDLAVYRCETGGAEVYIYFIGVDEDRLAGLLTISIET
jgi:Nuclease A inhibitor-like protein